MKCRLLAANCIIVVTLLAVFPIHLNSAIAVPPFLPTATPRFQTWATLVVTTDRLNVREGPGVSHRIVAVLSKGDQVVVVSGPETVDGTDWYEIRRDTKIAGWVSSKYVTLLIPDEHASPSSSAAVPRATSSPIAAPVTADSIIGPIQALQFYALLGSAYWIFLLLRAAHVYVQENARAGHTAGTGCAYGAFGLLALIMIAEPLARLISLTLFLFISEGFALMIMVHGGREVGAMLKKRSRPAVIQGMLVLLSLVIGFLNQMVGGIAYVAVLILIILMSYHDFSELLRGYLSRHSMDNYENPLVWPPAVLIQVVTDILITCFILPQGIGASLLFVFTISGVFLGYRIGSVRQQR
jgi:hypothetical protein